MDIKSLYGAAGRVREGLTIDGHKKSLPE